MSGGAAALPDALPGPALDPAPPPAPPLFPVSHAASHKVPSQVSRAGTAAGRVPSDTRCSSLNVPLATLAPAGAGAGAAPKGTEPAEGWGATQTLLLRRGSRGAR